MGLFDKVKNILFDEEEVEIPVINKEKKREIKKPEIKSFKTEENPIKEIKMPKEDFSDRENYKAESTFTFPIDFDDEEQQPITEKKEEQKKEYKPVKVVKENHTRDYSSYLRNKEEKKFKPTPIISPVYGVLDQNYKKEDVIVKKDILRKPSELTLEEVRKRAFGSLEEEIEQTLTEPIVEKKETIKTIKEVVETKVIEAPVDKKKTIGELMEENEEDIEIPSIDDNVNVNTKEYEKVDEVNEIEEEPKNSIDDLLDRNKEDNKEESSIIDEVDEDSDLFSLIDSMYEEKGE